MDLLKEFLDPIPLAAIVLVVVAIIFVWVISKSFRLPNDFAIKEAWREEVRYRLFDKQLQADAEADAQKTDEHAAQHGDGEAVAGSGNTGGAAT